MFVKMFFVFASYLTSLYCILSIVKFDPSKYSLKKSVFITAFYYSLSPVVDFTLFLIIVINFIPVGEYGTGIELLIGLVNLIILIPLYIIVGNNTYKKFKILYPNRSDLRACKSLWKSIVPKTFFVVVTAIWMFEVLWNIMTTFKCEQLK